MIDRSYDWIVFDATGTLLRPDPPAAEVYLHVGHALGGRISAETLEHRFHHALDRHFRGPAGALVRPPTSEADERRRWRRIVADTLVDLPPAAAERAFERLWDHFADPRAWALFEDAPPALEAARRTGARIAIASNFDARLRGIVAGHPALQAVTRVMTSAELGFAKPDPRFYQAASERLEAPAKRLLMIGDHPVNDVAGAEAAGWDALLVDRRGRFASRRASLPRLSDFHQRLVAA